MTGDDASRAFETARRRSVEATVASAVGVLALALSALVMLNAVDPRSSAPTAWAVAFFASAQVAAVALGLAVLSAAGLRRRTGTPADLVLLCRRNGVALSASFVAVFAVGAALPGEASAWVVLGGPALAALAAVAVGRSWVLARRLDRSEDATNRLRLAAVTVVVAVALAAAAAFAWDLLDHGTVAESLSAAGVEVGLALAGLVALGRPLGLGRRTRPAELA